MSGSRSLGRTGIGQGAVAAASEPGAAQGTLRAYGLVSALSGGIFSVLFVTALLLLRQVPGLGVPDSRYTSFYSSDNSRVLVNIGLYVVPFAGVAFLWYMVSTRTLVLAAPGSRPELPRWLQLASGVVFVNMMFVGTAAVGAVALLRVFSADPLPSVDVARALASVGYGMVFVYGVRVAGVFMIATTSLLRHAGLLPRWLVLLSYLAAVGLLVTTTFHPGILLVFPAWVLLVSAVVPFRVRSLDPDSTPRRESL